MTRRQLGFVVAVLWCLLAVAAPTFAEGAWILWMMGGSSPWDRVSTFPTREACIEAMHQQVQAVEKVGLKVTEDAVGPG
jgi:hypothetical protein